MDQSFRLPDVGLINRNKKLSFKFKGKIYYGLEGDTLASACLLYTSPSPRDATLSRMPSSA